MREHQNIVTDSLAFRQRSVETQWPSPSGLSAPVCANLGKSCTRPCALGGIDLYCWARSPDTFPFDTCIGQPNRSPLTSSLWTGICPCRELLTCSPHLAFQVRGSGQRIFDGFAMVLRLINLVLIALDDLPSFVYAHSCIRRSKGHSVRSSRS